MKTSYILLLLPTLTVFNNFNAQITITSSDMPSPGNVFRYESANDLLSEDFSLTGSNYSWDYSSGQMSNRDTVNIVSVGSTPIVYQYYFNNQFTQPDYYSDYAQKGQDLNAMGQVSITNRYDFYAVNSNSLEIKGFGAEINGNPASIKYDTIDQIYPLSMYDGMPTHQSSGYYLASVPGLGTYGQWIRREVTVDGYGSLTTPYETYSNTIRVKTVLDQTDTVYVDQFSFGQTFDRPQQIIYEWFTNSEKAPVMRAVMDGGQNTKAEYMFPITVGVQEITNEDLRLLPSAVPNVFVISNYSKEIQGIVYDLNGKIVASVQSETIDLSSFEQGMYIVSLHKNGIHQSFKLIR